MKKIILSIVLVVSTLPGMAQSTSGAEYLERMDKALYLEYADMKMKVYKKEKLMKYYRMEFYRKGNKMRMEFLEPAVERGRRMLNEETNLWMFMPRTSKVMKLPLKQAFMGSDASNRDLMRLAFTEDYEVVEMKNAENNILVFELKAKDLSISYSKLLVYFDAVHQVPIRQEMFSLSDKLIKTMEYIYAEEKGEYVPTECIIRDELLKDSITKMYYSNIQRKNNKSAVFFTLGSLKQ